MNKDKLSRLFPDIMEGIDFHEWHEVFPSVTGHTPFLPQNFAEAEQHTDTFRSDDGLIAAEMAKYSEFHLQMVDVIHLIMDTNQQSGMWDLYPDEEYPGLSFVHALAMQDIKYVGLFSDFLLSIKPRYKVLYLEFDIVRLIKKWNWGSETYHLLLAYWFYGHKERSAVLDYLSATGFSLSDKLQDDPEQEKFTHTLALFLSKPEFSPDNLQGRYAKLFDELTEEYIFPESKERTDWLKGRYRELLGKLQNNEPIVEENTDVAELSGDKPFSWDDWNDEDIPEV